MKGEKPMKQIKKSLGILASLALVFFGILGIVLWWYDELWLVIKGFVGLSLIIGGVIWFIIARSEEPEEVSGEKSIEKREDTSEEKKEE